MYLQKLLQGSVFTKWQETLPRKNVCLIYSPNLERLDRNLGVMATRFVADSSGSLHGVLMTWCVCYCEFKERFPKVLLLLIVLVKYI